MTMTITAGHDLPVAAVALIPLAVEGWGEEWGEAQSVTLNNLCRLAPGRSRAFAGFTRATSPHPRPTRVRGDADASAWGRGGAPASGLGMEFTR